MKKTNRTIESNIMQSMYEEGGIETYDDLP